MWAYTGRTCSRQTGNRFEIREAEKCVTWTLICLEYQFNNVLSLFFCLFRQIFQICITSRSSQMPKQVSSTFHSRVKQLINRFVSNNVSPIQIFCHLVKEAGQMILESFFHCLFRCLFNAKEWKTILKHEQVHQITLDR